MLSGTGAEFVSFCVFAQFIELLIDSFSKQFELKFCRPTDTHCVSIIRQGHYGHFSSKAGWGTWNEEVRSRGFFFFYDVE